ncbi:hypothetical protein [Geotalea toluenoxydans]|uniref:hypothetical protein n=1 Tax=Geotalea toluenoxydans TaxID=421624 RepID=UPI000B1E5E9D|nr:hypothetical protein [Geotalea toluenoxydans]
MADKFLASESLEDFLSDLMQIGTLHGPTINRQGVLSFNPVSSISDLNLDYHRTLLPKYLLPPRQETLHFESAIGYSSQPHPLNGLYFSVSMPAIWPPSPTLTAFFWKTVLTRYIKAGAVVLCW